jgi:Cu-Zn family superoxide dismutase
MWQEVYVKSIAGAVMGTLVAMASFSLAAEPKTLRTKLINTHQQQVGEATLTETPNGVLVRVELVQNPPGIAPGVHAIHIHEVGQCEPPFKSAGGHFNPLQKKHGFLSEQGKHLGDLPNMYVAKNAPVKVEFIVSQATLDAGKTGLLDANGSALVIHQEADDYRTDPAGDSGDRIACAVISASGARR